MSVLRIFDVSQYIAAGSRSRATISNGLTEDSGEYRPKELPIGGISFLMNVVFEYPDDDIVFVFDSAPTFKREIHEKNFPGLGGYKGKRPKKPLGVQIQRRLAYDILKDCGFNCIKVDTYEADDIIAGLVAKYKYDYDKVIIHNRDSDLFYLVEDNVVNAPVGDNGKYITRDNYEDMVVRGYDITYNTLLLHKLEKGDTSDNIPRVDAEMMQRIDLNITSEMYPMCGDVHFLRSRIREATNNDPRTMAIVDLLLVRDVPDEYLYLHDEGYDKYKFSYYARTLGNKHTRKDKIPCKCVELDCVDYVNGATLIEDAIEEYMSQN